MVCSEVLMDVSFCLPDPPPFSRVYGCPDRRVTHSSLEGHDSRVLSSRMDELPFFLLSLEASSVREKAEPALAHTRTFSSGLSRSASATANGREQTCGAKSCGTKTRSKRSPYVAQVEPDKLRSLNGLFTLASIHRVLAALALAEPVYKIYIQVRAMLWYFGYFVWARMGMCGCMWVGVYTC